MVTALPGGDLIEAGLADLESGVESVASLLVSIGAPRLQRAGVRVDSPFSSPEERRYSVLESEDSDSAHARYNALVRLLVSYERAAELKQSLEPSPR